MRHRQILVIQGSASTGRAAPEIDVDSPAAN
jgi:hypothetical protein